MIGGDTPGGSAMTEFGTSPQGESLPTDAIVRLAEAAGRLQRRLRRLTLLLAGVASIVAVFTLTKFSGASLGVAVVVIVVLAGIVVLLFDLSRLLGAATDLPSSTRDAYTEAVGGAQRLSASAASGVATKKTRLVGLVREVSGLVRSTTESLGAGRLVRLTNPGYLAIVGIALLAIRLW